MIFYSQRPFVYLIIGGVFERFPKLQVRAHRSRVRVGPRRARAPRRADGDAAHGAGPARCASTARPSRRDRATEYFQQNCHIGMSQPRPADIRGRARAGGHRPRDVGQRLPARGGHAAVHARAPAPGHGPPRAGADPADRRPATRPRSTASTSRRCGRRPTSSARPSPRSPSRWPSCPRIRTRRCADRRASCGSRRADPRRLSQPSSLISPTCSAAATTRSSSRRANGQPRYTA